MKSKLTTIMMVLLAAFITIGGTTSCKSKKRLAREAAEAEYKSRVEQAVKDLNAILDDETLWSLEEKEARVQTIKDWNLQNAEVDDLLFQVEKKLARERAQKEEEERREREEREKANAADAVLGRNFNSIANAAASSNVGVVDYSQFSAIKDVTDMQAQMQKLAQDAEKDFNEKAAGMSDEQKQEYYQQTMQRLQQQQADMMEPVRAKIEAAVKEVADAKGITVVINKEAVVYGGTDLTQDVLKKLNK